MMFWLVALALSLVASGFILIPLLRSARRAEADRNSTVVSIFEERLGELKELRSDGRLSDSEFDALKEELEDSLLAETAIESSESPESSQNRRISPQWVAALAVLLPIVAFALYSDVGLSLGAISDHNLATSLRETDPGDTTQMRQNADRLRRQLENQPDNHQGWYLLATYLMNASQPEQAAQAFEHLVAAYPGDVDLAARYAEMLFMADDRTLSTRVEKAMSNVVKLQPLHTGMMELRGMSAASSGDYRSALRHFERALSTLSGRERAAERGQILGAAIARVREMASAHAEDPRQSSEERRIEVKVSLASHLVVSPETPLFVYARAAGGPPMPLAVRRLLAADLPVTVALTEDMAMMPGMSLASFDDVEIVARLSSSGIANASPNDLEARSPVINVETISDSVYLEISQRRGELDVDGERSTGNDSVL
ncbi:MAG: c-type cytochrome biogenesis protein CcmI [OM182 bacterium MED-G24]|uniref:C-type cytochrome biogenesis protein CcmI n=1 Tax=OM182 bacterium MED-G24 TaxID=1986255 RepID=A0A2A5WVT8_9GAMM|nr:MAG: c-type cytochrome biogenesis protein CcmI [OM182 bacterium MED-G24]|tara:strand:- start:15207 stop:16493 length:1287 start_codon:yes stop_codon:yes gene_type:complete